MGTVGKWCPGIVTRQTHPCLVDERSRLQRVSGCFASHFVQCQLPQLTVNERQEIPGGLALTDPGVVDLARFRNHAQRWTGIAAGESANVPEVFTSPSPARPN